MAVSTGTASSSICNRIYNLSLAHPSISLPTSFPQRPISSKLFNLHLNSQTHNSSSFSIHHLCLASSAFDALEVAQESEGAQEQEDPEVESKGITQEQEEQDQNLSESSESGRLYVGNLPYSMTSSQLAEVFEEAGSVLSVEVVYDRVTDRSRGFAFVTMGSVEEAKAAIEMFDGSQVGGRTVKVNFPEVPRGGERLVMGPRVSSNYRGFIDSPHKIYAGNLGWGLTSQGLRDAFADQPGVLSAKVIYEKDTGRSRGFGFVSFETAEAVESALNAMNGVEVEGRPLRLNLAAERMSSASPLAVEESIDNSLDTTALLSSVSS